MMKLFLTVTTIFFAFKSYAQSPAETSVLRLSARVFSWEVDNKLDSLDTVFDAKFTAYTSSGVQQPKDQYMAILKGGKVAHNNVIIEESSAMIVDNTATVGGKGHFIITVNGDQKTLHLSYLEVFIRKNEHSPWKMLALHAGSLPN